jgi:8-amino-7-oxononanoate synthase
MLIDYLINAGRALIYTTGLPPATIAANLAALRLLQHNPDQGQPLQTMARSLVTHLHNRGIDTGATESHIIPVIIGDNERTVHIQQQLHSMGIHIGAIRPPTVPTGTARLRLALRADLTHNEFELLTTKLCEVLCM